MSATTKLITADELLMMPHREGRNDIRLELIRGELKKMSLTGAVHGILCVRIGVALEGFVELHDLGLVFGTGTGFLLSRDPDSVLGPDVAFLRKERLRDIENIEKFVPFGPDLAVEVLSPSNTVTEMDEKIALYFAAGSRSVWIVNPRQKTVAVYTSPHDVRILGVNDTLEGGEVLPGFALELSKLFAAVKR
jgi:Uma2 family endonuclease